MAQLKAELNPVDPVFGTLVYTITLPLAPGLRANTSTYSQSPSPHEQGKASPPYNPSDIERQQDALWAIKDAPYNDFHAETTENKDPVSTETARTDDDDDDKSTETDVSTSAPHDATKKADGDATKNTHESVPKELNEPGTEIDYQANTSLGQVPVKNSEVNERPRIAKVSMLYGEANPVYEQAMESHIAHGRLHNYPILVLRQKVLGRLWSKPAYLLSILLEELQKPKAEQLEWLFWFDADTYLVNPLIPLEIFLPSDEQFSQINFLCGNDRHGLNDGAFLLRVSRWSVKLMAASLSVDTFRPEVDLKYSEQSAIEHLVTTEPYYKAGTAIIPQRWMNAYMGPRHPDGSNPENKQITGNSVRDGDLLLHFAGHGDTKQQRMTTFMKAIHKDPSVWEKDVQETEYLEEISEYWADFKISTSEEEEAALGA